MKQTTATVVACLVLGWASCVAAQPGARLARIARPLDAYRHDTQQALIACSDAVVEGRMRVRASMQTRASRDCILKASAETTASFEAALRPLASTAAVQALHDYHAAFLLALGGILPQDSEGIDAYEQRQDTLFHRLAHAWSRVELTEALDH
jgi:hypothetical protein